MGNTVYNTEEISKIIGLYQTVKFGKYELLKYGNKYYIVSKYKIRKFQEKDLYQIMKEESELPKL